MRQVGHLLFHDDAMTLCLIETSPPSSGTRYAAIYYAVIRRARLSHGAYKRPRRFLAFLGLHNGISSRVIATVAARPFESACLAF